MGESNMQRMNRQYGTPAKRGMEVKYDGEPATITSCTGSHLRLRFPKGSKYARYRGCTFHPLYKIDYLDGIDPERRLAYHNERIHIWNDRLNDRITEAEYRERMSRPLLPSDSIEGKQDETDSLTRGERE